MCLRDGDGLACAPAVTTRYGSYDGDHVKGCSRKSVTCSGDGSAAAGIGILQDVEACEHGRGEENPAAAVRMELDHKGVVVRRADTEHERADIHDPVGARVLREPREVAVRVARVARPAPVVDCSTLVAAGAEDSSSGMAHKSGDRTAKDRDAEDHKTTKHKMEGRKAEVTRKPDHLEADDRCRPAAPSAPSAPSAVPVLQSTPEKVRIDARWPRNADKSGRRDHPVAGASEAWDQKAG